MPFALPAGPPLSIWSTVDEMALPTPSLSCQPSTRQRDLTKDLQGGGDTPTHTHRHTHRRTPVYSSFLLELSRKIAGRGGSEMGLLL